MEANATLLTWFVALTGVAVFLQACVLLGIFVALRRTAQSVNDVTREIKGSVLPLVNSTRQFVEKVSPQVQTMSTGLAELTGLVRNQSKGAGASISEMTARANSQLKRIDHMLTVALDGIEKTAGAIEHSVAAPVRQVNGVVAALKAIVGTYRTTPGSATARAAATAAANTHGTVYSSYVKPSSSLVMPNAPDPDRDLVL